MKLDRYVEFIRRVEKGKFTMEHTRYNEDNGSKRDTFIITEKVGEGSIVYPAFKVQNTAEKIYTEQEYNQIMENQIALIKGHD